MLSCLLASLHNANNCEDTARHAFAFRWISYTVIVSREFLISGTVIFLETVNLEKVVVCSADVVVLNSVVGLSTHGNNALLSCCVQRDNIESAVRLMW